MKLLDRYILREITRYAALGLAVFLFILLTPEVLRLSQLMAQENIDVSQVFTLFLSVLPRALMWALPLAVLSGLLMGVSRLAADCEVIALQAAGLGPTRLLRPTLVFAAVGALLTLATTVWWGPLGARTVERLQSELSAGQVSYEIQPRVFDERFPNLILYVDDTEEGGARWKGVFLADLSTPDSPKVTLARSALVVPEPSRAVLLLQLSDGSTHTYSPQEPDRYSVSTFAQSVLTIQLPSLEGSIGLRRYADLSLAQLWRASQQGPDWRSARADFHRRLSLPVACLIFGLIAVPLGLLAERSGRSLGFVAAIGVAIAYYFLFLLGDRLARQGDLTPGLGAWLANLVLLAPVPYFLVGRVPRRRWEEMLGALAERGRALFSRRAAATRGVVGGNNNAVARAQGAAGSRLPRTLDLYVVREVLFYFVMLGAALLVLFGLFTVLEMVDDIARNHIPWSVVARFLWYLMPQLAYLLAPLALLLAILVAMALLSKRNELVATKGAGISLYRLAVPVLLAGLALSALLFALDDNYLPYANQRQEALRNQIKGRPPQTFFQIERRWLFGERRRIYHYAFFDSSQKLLGQLSVFELSPEGFSLQRRLYAQTARWNSDLHAWVLVRGWEREFDQGQAVAYHPFDVASFRDLDEPPSYFQKEVRESSQMNWRELGAYIRELQQSGFQVARLVIEWHRKFAFPLIATIIVLLAFPFGATMGHRGAVGGLALGIGLGFTYWVLAGFFEALGNFALLPPFLAAWGPNLIFAFGGVYLLLQMDT